MYDFIPLRSSIGTTSSAERRSTLQRLGVDSGLHYVISRRRPDHASKWVARKKNKDQDR
jgi:hypothetical protein